MFLCLRFCSIVVCIVDKKALFSSFSSAYATLWPRMHMLALVVFASHPIFAFSFFFSTALFSLPFLCEHKTESVPEKKRLCAAKVG